MKVASMIVALLLSSSAMAGPHADALAVCLTDSTSGKDRKELARWVFVAISQHPSMTDLLANSANSKEQAFQSAGALVTRLLADDCTKQAKAAIANEGAESFRIAFDVLGRIAMQELMSHPDVSTAINGFDRYLDQSKLEASFKATE